MKQAFSAIVVIFVFLLSPAIAGKPPITLRVHLQASPVEPKTITLETGTSRPMKINRYPELSEKDIDFVHIYQGPFGPEAKVKFGMHGTLALQSMTTARKGETVVILVNNRVVASETIVEINKSGALAVPNITAEEARLFLKGFKKPKK
ncbi:MAG: hypothetical protein SGI71_10170 [Verrucomicrobiota bacterium]|nr:hypothetical protein [Verrucomicrobiota bacterium]